MEVNLDKFAFLAAGVEWGTQQNRPDEVQQPLVGSRDWLLKTKKRTQTYKRTGRVEHSKQDKLVHIMLCLIVGLAANILKAIGMGEVQGTAKGEQSSGTVGGKTVSSGVLKVLPLKLFSGDLD